MNDNYYFKNRTKLLARSKEYYFKNKEKKIAYAKEYYKNNSDKIKEYEKSSIRKEKANKRSKLYAKENKDKINKRRRNSKKHYEWQKEYFKEYRKQNKAILTSNSERYEAIKDSRVPKWLTEIQLIEIDIFYKNAVLKTKETGIQYSVDHIIPLRGKIVSGLHVPWNLQIISMQENRIKSNIFK